jgi:hypothetical protein
LADTEAQSKVRESVKEKKVQKRYEEEFKREAVELVSPISSKPASDYRIKTSHFYGY